jgi:hypothetical protein
MSKRNNDLWGMSWSLSDDILWKSTKRKYTNRQNNYKRRANYSRKKTYRKSKDLIDPIAWLILWFVFFSYFTYINFILPNIEKIKFYAILFFIATLVILSGFLFYIVRKRIKNKKLEYERIENIPQFLLDLENKIKYFKPIRQYKEERLYQTELVGFLKNNYPDLKIEETKDYSRPDIIIDNIAIEIKWPTKMSGLKTLPDKINSYLPKRDYLFIVLFNIQITEDIQKNKIIYESKKQEILDNTIETKREKIFFIEID